MGMPAPAMHVIRPVVIAMIAVAAMFVFALWMSHYQQREIGQRAQEIVERDDTGHTREAAREIARIHDESRDLAMLLGAIGVAAAIGAGGLALGVIRRRSQLVAEHQALLDARATELEAFAGRVAHDLRNPLGAIALRIQTLRMRECPPDAIEKLAENAARMDMLIEDLLEFARSGAAPDLGAHTRLRDVVDLVVADARLQAEHAGAELVIENVCDIEVCCTRGALASILGNLLENATKYVSEGTGAHRIFVRAGARNGRMHMEIADTGPGLPPGSETMVFEPFRRVGNHAQRGLGLGLATVKRIVEAYGGRVGVQSTPGRGAMFWVELPLCQRSAAPSTIAS
jgi:signal transduction histidine kinase